MMHPQKIQIAFFFDANRDSFPDLYVASGGNSFSTGSSALLDRLYINDTIENFEKTTGNFAPPGGYATNSTVTAADFNDDDFTDLFIGERLKLFSTGIPARGFLLINDGAGNFKDVTSSWSKDFSSLGMIADAEFIDWNSDGLLDLIIVGEWMAPRIFINTGESFQELLDVPELNRLSGLWKTVHVVDLNKDNRMDLLLGNHGLNSHFRPTIQNPLTLWVGDIEQNGLTDQFISRSIDGRDYPFVLRHDFIKQFPSLSSKYPNFKSYSDQTVQEIFSEKNLNSFLKLTVNTQEHVAIINKPVEPHIITLPKRSQFSSVYDFWSGKILSNNSIDILSIGNLKEVKPMAGPYDASYGTLINWEKEGDPKPLWLHKVVSE